MQKELVSIVIPVYQSARYLQRAVDSVLAQTYRPIEILLIDDGSTDQSGKLCDRLARKHAEITVYHREHKGVSAARNYGISQAQGKYIQFVDSDDEAMPNMTELMVMALQRSRAYMAVCGYEIIEKDTKRQQSFEHIPYVSKAISTERLYDIVKYDLLSVTWNKMYVRERIRHLYDETLLLCEDSVFCTEYFMDNPKVTICPELLYRYHQKDGNLNLRGCRIWGYPGIKKYYARNRRLVQGILNKSQQKDAKKHIDRVFFYGVYTYIFEAMPYSGLRRAERIAFLESIMRDEVYQAVVPGLKKLYCKELCYKIASTMQNGSLLHFMIQCRKCFISKGKKNV